MKLKSPIIVPSFKQKKLRFDIVRGPIDVPRDVQLREEQRLEDEDDGEKELLLDALIRDACGDDEALDVRMTYQEVLENVDIKLAQTKDLYTPRIVADSLTPAIYPTAPKTRTVSIRKNRCIALSSFQ